MQNLVIAATESTPEVSFDFAAGQFALRGRQDTPHMSGSWRPLG